MNFLALIPEILIVGIVATLALLEIFRPQFTRAMASRLNIAGVLLVGGSLLFSIPWAGSTFQEMFVQDTFALFFKMIFLVSAATVFLMKREEKEGGAEFNLLFWSALLGMFVLVSSRHFLLLFISLELLTLSLYILTAYSRKNIVTIEAGLKYLVLGSLASAFLLYGMSLIYAASGRLSFDALRVVSTEGLSENWIFLAGALLVISALGFKVAAVPFHVWVPDVYQAAPTPVVAFLSVASKSAGFAALLRILFEALGPFDEKRVALFALLASLTLLYGNLGALVQRNMKRLLGYSSIGHAGFLLMALATTREFAGNALLFYLVAYAFTNLTAFFIVSLVENSRGVNADRLTNDPDSIEAFQGLFRRSPLLAAGMFLAMLSLAGVPPLAGFFSKFFVLFAAAKSGLSWLVVLGAVNVAIALYYYLGVIRLIYFEEAKNDTAITLTLPSRCLLLGLMAGILVVGIWQAPFLRLASAATASLF